MTWGLCILSALLITSFVSELLLKFVLTHMLKGVGYVKRACSLSGMDVLYFCIDRAITQLEHYL